MNMDNKFHGYLLKETTVSVKDTVQLKNATLVLIHACTSVVIETLYITVSYADLCILQRLRYMDE